MIVGDSITRIRVILRDNTSLVFTDDMILRVWGEVQARLVQETQPLWKLVDLPVPAVAEATYTQEWEREFLGRASGLLYNFLSPYTYTQPWESNWQLDEQSMVGGFTITQSWESFYVEAQNRVRHYFPDDIITPLWMAYDEKPIHFIFREEAEKNNSAFHSKTGTRPFVYIDDLESKNFYLYPKVTATYGVTDQEGEYGEVVYDDASSNSLNPSSDFGCINFSTNESVDSDYGIVVRYQRPESALTLLYVWEPVKPSSVNDTILIPRWMVKYVEFGVLSKLLRADTDLKNSMLSDHFQARFEMGKQSIETYMSNRNEVRSYVVEGLTRKTGRSNRILADLPSGYPSLWRRR